MPLGTLLAPQPRPSRLNFDRSRGLRSSVDVAETLWCVAWGDAGSLCCINRRNGSRSWSYKLSQMSGRQKPRTPYGSYFFVLNSNDYLKGLGASQAPAMLTNAPPRGRLPSFPGSETHLGHGLSLVRANRPQDDCVWRRRTHGAEQWPSRTQQTQTCPYPSNQGQLSLSPKGRSENRDPIRKSPKPKHHF